MLQTSLFLFLLPSLSSAFYTPFPNLNEFDRRSLACQSGSDKWLSFMPFTTEQDSQFEFGIKTTWTIFYPHLLSMALRIENFTLAGQPSNGFCNWQKARVVVSNDWLRTFRGDIYWTHKYSPTKSDVKISNAEFHQTGGPSYQTPHSSVPSPKNETLDRIARILETNAPDADIYRWLCFFLGYWCLLGELLLIGIVVAYHHYHKRNVQREAEEYVEGIELDILGANSLAKQIGPEDGDRLQDDELVSRQSVATHEPGERFDPPPVYSLDGAGRER